MKIRITQLGFEAFTGLLGDVHFEGGVSVSDVSEQQAAYVRAMFVTEEVTPSEQEGSESTGKSAELTPEGQEAAALAAEAKRLAAEAERERAEAEAAEAAALAAKLEADQAAKA